MTGTVAKRARKGGKASWGYVFDAGRDQNGKRLQPTKSGFATKKEAAHALRAAILEFEAERDASPPSEVPAFGLFFERWMQEHAERKCAPKTIERYRELGTYATRQTLELGGQRHVLGDVTLDKFGPMQMELMINALRDRGGQKTKEYPDGRPLSPRAFAISPVSFTVASKRRSSGN